jgi:hypothetical protein
MSNPRHASAFVFSLSCALGGCIDAVDDAADTAVAEQAIYHNEVRVRRIQADILYEGGDEIYLTASQTSGGSVNIIRPPTVPDYWRFDTAPMAIPQGPLDPVLSQHVGTIVSNSYLVVNLWEQEFGDDHEIGTIGFRFNNSGEPSTYDTPTGKFLGVESNNGWFRVRFTNGARYYVWFEVGP